MVINSLRYWQLPISEYIWFISSTNCWKGCAQSLQLCLTLCNLPDSSVLGIFLARVPEWVAMPSSRESSWPRDQTLTSCVSCTAGGFSTTKPPGKPYTTFGNHKSNLFFCLFLKYNWPTTQVSSCYKTVIFTMHFKMITILSPVTICQYIKTLLTAYIPHPLHGSLPCCG